MRITSCTLSWSTWSIVETDKNGASGNSFLYFHRKTSWQPKSPCPMMMEMKIFSSLRMVDYTRRLHGAEGRAKQFLLNGNQENVISLAVQLLCHTSSQLYSPLPAQSIIRFSMRFDSNVFFQLPKRLHVSCTLWKQNQISSLPTNSWASLEQQRRKVEIFKTKRDSRLRAYIRCGKVNSIFFYRNFNLANILPLPLCLVWSWPATLIPRGY